MATRCDAPAFKLQDVPPVLAAAVPGRWLLAHCTPSWRISDPEKGFQRVVRDERARQIAGAVLDQGRSFPNAIVLATDRSDLAVEDGIVRLTAGSRFLVVDGQHRLWAQRFSDYEGTYACIVHLGLSEVEMANLFLEINDNQKRVPSSLRWDLVRLVRPDDDPYLLAAAQLVYDLATAPESPLYQKIDLTGEQGEIKIKQASVAPELRSLVAARRGSFRGLTYERQYEALTKYLGAIRDIDASGWRRGDSPLVAARVLRALLRLLPAVADKVGKDPDAISMAAYTRVLQKIKLQSISSEKIRAIQGSAGIRDIQETLAAQMGL